MTLSRGKRCRETPYVFELLLQLTLWGAPATQNLPEALLLRFCTTSTLSLQSIAHSRFPLSKHAYTTSDITPHFWPRTKWL